MSTGAIFLFFLKVGSVLYGSGYVLLAFLRADLVVRYRWLTEAEILDAVAVGQLTPGPVFTVATFVGYILDGLPGALAATVGIFLPAFLFVAVSGPLVVRIRRSPPLSAFLDGVIASSLALMAIVAFELAKGSLLDVGSRLIFLASAVALLRFRVSSSWPSSRVLAFPSSRGRSPDITRKPWIPSPRPSSAHRSEGAASRSDRVSPPPRSSSAPTFQTSMA